MGSCHRKTHWTIRPLGAPMNFKMRGHDLMGGYVLVPWISKCDMDFKINHVEFTGHWNSAHPCPACSRGKVQDPPMAWNKFDEKSCMEYKSAWYIGSICQALLNAEQTNPPSLAYTRGGGLGMHPNSLYIDSLHVIDLGVATHVCGNILHVLCYDDMLPSNPGANVKCVETDQ